MSTNTAQNTAIESNGKYLNISEAASILSISSSTLRRFEQEGKIKSHRQSNGYRNFNLDEILDLKEKLKKISTSRHIEHAKIPKQATTPVVLVTPTTNFATPKLNIPKAHWNIATKGLKTAVKVAFILILFANSNNHLPNIKANIGQGVKVSLAEVYDFVTGSQAADKNGGSKPNFANFLLNVLGAQDQKPDYIFNVNVPTNLLKDVTAKSNVTVEGGLTVNGSSALTGGVITPTLAGVNTIDITTKGTFEKTLQVAGDASGTVSALKVIGLNGIAFGSKKPKSGEFLVLKSNKWVGEPSTNITALGEIEEGTWQADPIEPAYLSGVWYTAGNSGIDPASVFLGTKDAQPLIIKTNDTERARFLSTGALGIGSVAPTGLFSVGSSNQFVVSSTGDVTKLKGVTYAWPSAQATAANRILSNDGSGNLSWGNVVTADVTDDSLDFTQFKDALALDATTDIATAGFNLTTSGSGAVSLNNTGAFTVAGATTLSSTLGVTGATTLSSTLAVTGATTFSSTINSNTFTSTALTFAGASPSISASTAGTPLAIDAGTSGAVNIAGTSTGNVNIAGGSGATGCTIANSTGNLVCSGDISTTASGGQQGWWTRSGALLFPSNVGDNFGTTGNVGVGTTSPVNKLDVSGSVAFGSLPTTALPQSNSAYFSGNVGLGTTNPGYKLDVSGTVNATGAATFGSTGNFTSSLTAANGFAQTTGALSITSTSGSANLTLSSSVNAFNINSGLLNVDTTNTRVGIGSTAPASLLSVGGTNQFQVNSSGNVVRINDIATSFPSSQGAANSLFLNDGSGNLSWASPTGTGIVGYWNRLNSTLVPTTITDNIGTTGSVGIGTTSPLNRLDVSGSVAFGSLPTTALPRSNSAYFSGNVGIGNTNPESPLTFAALAANPSTTPNKISLYPGLNYGFGVSSTFLDYFSNANHRWFTGSSPAEKMRLTSTGLVGIGTSVPASLLSVAGSGGIGATFAIFAAPSNGLIVQGNVGIGISSPNNALDISGSVAFGSLPTTALPQANSAYFSGNVGIGTTNPGYKLDVSGTLNATGAATFGSTGNFTSTLTAANGLTLTTGALSLTASSGSAALTLSSSTTAFNVNAGILDIDSTNSRVGVGTTAPLATFSVGTSSPFRVSSTGDLSRINDVAYAWPSSQGSANTLLINNGSGTLSWNTLTGSNITADSLDFTEFRDAMALDATTGINLAGYNLNIAGTGSVGIGTSSPLAASRLNVQGAGTGVGFSLLTQDSAGTHNLALLDNGNVGIGTTAPGEKLDLYNGNIKLNGGGSSNPTLKFFDGGGQKALIGYMDAGDTLRLGYSTDGLLQSVNQLVLNSSNNVGIGTSSPGSRLEVRGSTSDSTATALHVTNSSGTSLIYVKNNGDVGIGNLAGQSSNVITALYVSKAYTATDFGGSGITDQGIVVTNNIGPYPLNVPIGLTFGGGPSDTHGGIFGILKDNGGSTVGDIAIATRNSTSDTYFTERMRVLSTGNIGIGTSAPKNKLDVSGSVAFGSLPTTALPQSNSAYFSGNVGIGTTNPSASLSVGSSSQFRVSSTGDLSRINDVAYTWPSSQGSANTLLINNGSGTLSWNTLSGSSITADSLDFTEFRDAMALDATTGINLAGYNLNIAGTGSVGVGTSSPLAASRLSIQGAGTGVGFSLLTQDSSGTHRFAVLDNGNVGIGTTAPVQALDISGIANVSTGFRISNAATSGNFLRGNGTNFVSSAIQSTDVNGFISGNPNFISKFTGVNSLGNSLLFDNGTIIGTTANTGIGTTNPLNKLDVSGSVAFGSLPTQALPQSNSAYFSGNVGVGTTNPGYKLDVSGTVNTTGAATFGSTGNFTSTLTAANGLTLTTGAISLTSSSGSAALTLSSSTTAFNVNAGTLDIDTTNTRIGVGTTAPLATFSVGTSSPFRVSSTGDLSRINDVAYAWPSSQGSANTLLINNGSGTLSWNTLTGSNITADSLDFTEFKDSMALDATTGINLNSFNLNIAGTGSVGIGTSSPLAASRLNVQGAGTGVGFSLLTQDSSGAHRFAVLDNGNVGIGTTAPGFLLEVAGTARINGNTTIGDASGDTLTINASALSLANASTLDLANSSINSLNIESGLLNLDTSNTRVGIGSTAPASLLSVGNTNQFRVSSTGDLSRINDIAYSFPSSQGAASSVLTNNGSGTLTWGTLGASSITADSLDFTEFRDSMALDATTDINLAGYNLNIAGTGSVGIGTSSPLAASRLNVQGSGTGVGFSLLTQDSAGTHRFAVLDNGNVGIGTTAPSTLFHISGSTVATLNMTGGSGTVVQAQQSGSNTWSLLNSSGGLQIAPSQVSSAIGVNIQPTARGSIAADTPTFAVTATANTFSINGAYANQNFSKFLQPSISGTANTITNASNLYIAGAVTTNGTPSITNSSALRIDTAALTNVTNGYGLFVNTPTGATNNYAAVFVDGNVGIGTSIPTNRLDVSGSVSFGSLPTQALPQSNSAYFSGNVGIGTTNPGFALEIAGTARINGNTTLGDASGDALTINAATITMSNASTVDLANSSSTALNLESGLLDLDTQNSRVGIGTTAPGYKLDVAGTLNATGAATFGSTGNFTSTLTAANGFTQTTGALSLTATSGSAAITLTSATQAFNINSGLFNADTSNSRVGIGTTVPGSMFAVGAGSLFQVNSSGNIVRINNVATSFPSSQGAANTFLKNDGSGNLSWATSTGGSTCNSSNDCTVVLTPEYPGAIISADGASNTGTLTSDVENHNTNYYYNYYEFSSGQTSLQDYDVYVTWQLPSSWADWDDAANAIQIDFATEDTSSANNQIDITVYRQGDADTYSASDSVSSPAADWESTIETQSPISITKTNLNTVHTWTAGDIMIIKIKLQSKDNYYSRVGNIRIIYENS